MSALASLVESRLERLSHPLALEWPGGRAGRSDAGVKLRLRDARLLQGLAEGSIGGLANAYVSGELDIDGRLPDVMAIAAELAGDPVRLGQRGPLTRLVRNARSLWLHRQKRDAQQVRFHYDRSDDFYALWLDPMRVYSCAYYQDESMTLDDAQQAKLEHVCRKLHLRPGQRLLDVGAGWGALLLWAAEHHGVHATGITLSHNQHAHVQRLIEEKGLRGRVEMHLLDYRDLNDDEGYDRIASVGMFEHVGAARLDHYFERLHGLLRPGGLVLNHGITAGGVDNSQLGAGMGDFIEQHIFPGGELVHVSRVQHSLSASGLELLDAENLRPHYARTLWDWSDALERQLDQANRFASEATVRAYRLYLAGCAMCFEHGWLSLYQLLAARPDGDPQHGRLRAALSDYPFSRDYMYPGKPIDPPPRLAAVRVQGEQVRLR